MIDNRSLRRPALNTVWLCRFAVACSRGCRESQPGRVLLCVCNNGSFPTDTRSAPRVIYGREKTLDEAERETRCGQIQCTDLYPTATALCDSGSGLALSGTTLTHLRDSRPRRATLIGRPCSSRCAR
jgi:hypothetical protein